MKSFLSPLFVVVAFTFANDITVSKDSLKVYNDLLSSFADIITVRNGSALTVALDSAYVLLNEFDTTGMASRLSGNGSMEVCWIDTINKCDFLWHLNETEGNRFRLSKKSSIF